MVTVLPSKGLGQTMLSPLHPNLASLLPSIFLTSLLKFTSVTEAAPATSGTGSSCWSRLGDSPGKPQVEREAPYSAPTAEWIRQSSAAPQRALFREGVLYFQMPITCTHCSLPAPSRESNRGKEQNFGKVLPMHSLWNILAG